MIRALLWRIRFQFTTLIHDERIYFMRGEEMQAKKRIGEYIERLKYGKFILMTQMCYIHQDFNKK